MITFNTCCKINIGLYVTGKRPDGYHNLQTIFYPIPLCDNITIEETDADSLSLSGIHIEGDVNDNLVIRAVNMLRSAGHDIPPLSISLCKNIPSGAGLGGGSSDAAGVARELDRHYKLGVGDAELERMVGKLGADCPFFVRHKPVLAEGIGDIFSPTSIDLSGMYIVLVKPAESVSTREAYAQVKPAMPDVPLSQKVAMPIDGWRDSIVNDFEASVFPAHPVIREVKEQLYRMGAVYASMSGSGSSVFGLFNAPQCTDGLFHGMFVYQSRL